MATRKIITEGDGMGEDKKYYWLKLKKDFFKRHDIQIIESMPNGKDYILFYLKLLVESVDHDGNLRFSETIPYNESMISTITHTNIDIVRSAMKVFTGLKMIDVLEDKTIYMHEVERMMGTETYWAEQKRKQREIGQCPQNVQLLSNVSNQEIEIDKDKELELDKELNKERDTEIETKVSPKEQVPYTDIVNSFNEICSSLSKVKSVSSSRKNKMKVRWSELKDLETFEILFKKVQASNFLKGDNKNKWKASFDWLMENDNNYVKVLEDNYKNKNDVSHDEIQEIYEWAKTEDSNKNIFGI